MVLQRQVEVHRTDESGEFLCIATYLPLRRWRDVIPFLQITSRVEKQLKETEGLVRFGLRADLLHKRFWTFTVWRDRAAADTFVVAEPHATAVRRMQDWPGEGAAFAEWKSTDGSINWIVALQRLQHPTFSYRVPGK